MAWYTVTIATTLNAHSGYHLPFTSSAEEHDYHHLSFNQNYGDMMVLDFIYGTSEKFYQSHQYMNHRVLLSLTPLVPASAVQKNR
jgi:hypothetical protein